jgi:hypothetical protein
VQKSVREHDEARADRVAAIGRDDPALRRLVPADLGDRGLEQGVAVQVPLLRDRLAVREDLRAAAVLLDRQVVELFEQRQVDVRLDVARQAG